MAISSLFLDMAFDLAQLGIKGTEDWYFGTITREQANAILSNSQVGMYLVRGSKKEPGGFVLSVRDVHKSEHFKITVLPRESNGGFKFTIGHHKYLSIQGLLESSIRKTLLESPLTEPAPRPVYWAKTDYRPKSDNSEFSLRLNDSVLFLDVAPKPEGAVEKEWWHVVKKDTGEIGCVPKSCLRSSLNDNKFDVLRQLNLPFDVEAVQPRNPNIFDPHQLRLEPGDHVRVKQIVPDCPELWYGLNLRTRAEGFFPFNYVRLVPQELGGAENCRHSGLSNHSAASSGRFGNRVSRASGCTLDEHVV